METEIITKYDGNLHAKVKWSIPKGPQVLYQDSDLRVTVTFQLQQNGVGAWVPDSKFIFESADGTDALGATRWAVVNDNLSYRGIALLFARLWMERDDTLLMPHVVDDKVVSQA